MKMILPTGKGSEPRRHSAFTLIELILVMALLVVTVAITLPKLKGFFGGRNVDAEARRFAALRNYGQSRAVNEGVPMMLWVDPVADKYGLEQEPGYNDKDDKAIEESVVEGVTIGVSRDAVKTPLANSQTGRIMTGQAGQSKGRRDAIYFLPEGSINTNRSVSAVSFQSKDGPALWIAAVDGAMSSGKRK
jgi:prepilin-type N-terminal cleavage/methylation domain-containing protein